MRNKETGAVETSFIDADPSKAYYLTPAGTWDIGPRTDIYPIIIGGNDSGGVFLVSTSSYEDQYLQPEHESLELTAVALQAYFLPYLE